MKRFGVPYKGSKNQITEWIYSHFPKADNFYDLFAGGCSITQIALMKQEFRHYFCNDIDSDGITLFLDAIHGKFQNENRWISRADFFKLKNKEPYIKYCWSFGNNGRDYLYSREKEPYKKAWHYAIYFHDYSLAKDLGLDLTGIEPVKNIHDRYIALKRIIEKSCKENISRCQSLEQLLELETLPRLQSQSLHVFSFSFDKVKILKNSVVYCDIPYVNTDGYENSFDHERFYSWCKKQKELVLVSEYTMPESFICVDEIKKRSLLSADPKGCTSKMEKIFIPKHQLDLYNEMMKLKYLQMEFDFGGVA